MTGKSFNSINQSICGDYYVLLEYQKRGLLRRASCGGREVIITDSTVSLHIDSEYPAIEIMGIEFDASRILEELDITAFNQLQNEISSCLQDDLESAIEDEDDTLIEWQDGLSPFELENQD